MSKSIRDLAAEAAGKVGGVVQVRVDGLDEPIHIKRLSIEERYGCADTGLKPGRRANAAAAINLLTASVVQAARVDDKLVPYMSRDEWVAFVTEHEQLAFRIATEAQKVQGDASAEATEDLGKG